MANNPQEPAPPQSMASVTPLDVGGASGHTRILIDAVKESVSELKANVRELRSNRFSDMMWHIGALVAVGVVLGGMMIAADFRLEDKINALASQADRVETKIDDIASRFSTPTPQKR